MKLLGILMDDNVSWSENISNLIKNYLCLVHVQKKLLRAICFSEHNVHRKPLFKKLRRMFSPSLFIYETQIEIHKKKRLPTKLLFYVFKTKTKTPTYTQKSFLVSTVSENNLRGKRTCTVLKAILKFTRDLENPKNIILLIFFEAILFEKISRPTIPRYNEQNVPH